MGEDILPNVGIRQRHLHGLIRIRITNQADTLSYWRLIRVCYTPPLSRYRMVALAKSSPCSNAGGSATLPLVIAFSGDRHRTHRSNPVIFSPNKVVALLFAPVAVWIGATALLATVGVDQLDKATAHQCLTHDWPADKAVATSKWCVANGYKI